jgi:hypothetical protein
MAKSTSNNSRVGEAFSLLAQGLRPFVDFHMKKTVARGEDWVDRFASSAKPRLTNPSIDDPSFLLRVMADCWRGTFDRQLDRTAKNLVFTLRDKRNEWAHNKAIQTHDAQFTLSGILTLLELVDAKEADQVRISLDELTRSLYEKGLEKGQVELANVVDGPQACLSTSTTIPSNQSAQSSLSRP